MKQGERDTGAPVVAFVTGSAGDWGGASRVLYTMLRNMDREKLVPLLLLPSDGPIVPELDRLSLRYKIWGPLTESGGLIDYLAALWRALVFFKRENVRLLHLNSANFWRPAEVLAARLLRIPVVVHYHVIIHRPAPFSKWCTAAIAVSAYTGRQSGPAALPKHVIYNPIDLRRFDAGHSLRNKLSIPDGAKVVSFLGQIRDIKGIRDFIEMAHRIKDADARFLIAGECRDPARFAGSLTEDELQSLIVDDDRISYIGYVKEVEDVYHTSDIVVVPSRWEEPLGLINLEAGACRCAIVATRVGGIPEVVKDGVNGLLVPREDVSALADAVFRLLQNPALARDMGQRGRELVEQQFTGLPVREFENLLTGIARQRA
jgi:glycosyltransferase involved in cell wall biosynthesis